MERCTSCNEVVEMRGDFREAVRDEIVNVAS